MTRGEHDQTDTSDENDGLRAARRQYAIPVGLMFGSLAAAVLCLGYAWLQRSSQLPSESGQRAVTSMLWRTTIVVGTSALLVIGCFIWARLREISVGLRAQFLSYVSPALVVLAISGLIALGHGQTKSAFDAGASAQQTLAPSEVATVAKWAWWCACLAVAMIAITAVVGYLSASAYGRPAEQPAPLFTSPGLAAVVALAVVVIVAVGVVATTGSPPVGGQTAPRVDAPTLTTVTGKVAYRIKLDAQSAAVPAGAGFVRVVKSDSSYSSTASIEGYDGATGKRRWVFGPRPEVDVIGSTGVGPESVVLARNADLFIGLDATTGTQLWSKPAAMDWQTGHLERYLSSSVILTSRPNPEPPGPTAAGNGTAWTALAPRTGEVLWTKTFRYHCGADAYVTDGFVVVQSCETKPGVVADLLDPATGQSKGEVAMSAVGADPADVGPGRGSVTVADARGGVALVTVSRYAQQRHDNSFVVDLSSGRVVQPVPEGRAASFIDTRSLVIKEYRGRDLPTSMSILDLASGKTITTQSFWSNFGSDDEGFGLWARNGDEWSTFTPDDERVVMAMASTTDKSSVPLRTVNTAGAVRVSSYPCGAAMQGIPGIAAVPGALLVRCDDQFVGIR